MTLPGGPADKLGNRYEKWWTLSEFVRMLRGDTDAIRIEDPGVDKTEFVVEIGSSVGGTGCAASWRAAGGPRRPAT